MIQSIKAKYQEKSVTYSNVTTILMIAFVATLGFLIEGLRTRIVVLGSPVTIFYAQALKALYLINPALAVGAMLGNIPADFTDPIQLGAQFLYVALAIIFYKISRREGRPKSWARDLVNLAGFAFIQSTIVTIVSWISPASWTNLGLYLNTQRVTTFEALMVMASVKTLYMLAVAFPMICLAKKYLSKKNKENNQ